MRSNLFSLSLFVVVALFTLSTAAEIKGTNWFPLGPAPILNGAQGDTVGRASAIAVNPFRLEELWIGTAAGGVWHSVDFGENWKPISDGEASLAIGALAVDECTTAGCAKIYAGTGENAIRRDTYYGRGLLMLDQNQKSPSWKLMTGAPYTFELGSINDVVLDHTTTGENKRIYVTLSSGTTSAASQSTVTAPEPLTNDGSGGYGIYRSDNNGISWIKLDVTGAEGIRPTDLKMDPNDSQILYAGFLSLGVFKSIDSGSTWCPLTVGIAVPADCPVSVGFNPNITASYDHMEIALYPADTQTLYVSVGHCTDRLFSRCIPSIFRSTNGGLTWERRRAGTSNTPNFISCPAVYSRYTHGLSVHPSVPDTLLMTGIHLCRSTDGGVTFFDSDTNDSTGVAIHVDHREVIFHPLDQNIVFDVGDGGFFRSTNGGLAWSPGNQDLQITGFYSLTSSPNTPRVLGGSQDNSGQLWRGTRAWDRVGGGDGAYSIIDLDNPLIMYLGYNAGGLAKSTNGGLFFEFGFDPGVGSSNVSFNAPVFQDPLPPHTLYYGATQLWASTSDAGMWTNVSPILATGQTDEIGPGKNVIMAIGARHPLVYIGYYGGDVFASKTPCDNNSCWANISENLPQAPVTDIAVHPDSGVIAYAAFSGFGDEARIWKTTNFGTSWNPASTGLPKGVPVNALAIEADAPHRIWAGLDSGPDPERSNVYRSTNGGRSWSPHNFGLPNAPIHDLSIDSARGRIYAAMHGRGVYVLGSPSVNTYQGWHNGLITDVPVFGSNFPVNQPCTLSLLQQSGDICATATKDALQNDIRTDLAGTLVTSDGNDTPVVLACLDSVCLGGVPINDCNDDADGDGVDDPLSTVVVDCGSTPGTATILGAPELANPPGSLIDIGFYSTQPLSNGGHRVNLNAGSYKNPSPVKFDLSVYSQNRGHAQSLCRASVALAGGKSADDILAQARSTLRSNQQCVIANVTAQLKPTLSRDNEDADNVMPQLAVDADTTSGTQVVAGLSVKPGEITTGTCFSVRGLGVAVHSQLTKVRTTFSTEDKGAHGGFVSYIEKTPLGNCAVTVKTTTGMSAELLVESIAAQLKAKNSAQNSVTCPNHQNARHVKQRGNSLISLLATDIQICVEDAGVGFDLLPN